jgi:uncharacterized cupredoxin-like copper-binding protein
MHSTLGHGRNKVSNRAGAAAASGFVWRRQRSSNHRLKLRLAGDLAADVANEVAEPCAQEAQLPLVALELFGMGIAVGHHGRLTMRLWVTRRFGIKVVVAVLYVLCAGARLHAHEGHFSAGEPGDPKKPFRVVEITMQESNGTMSYRPKALEVRRGEQIKFVITNAGMLAHEFILANTADNLKHAELMKKYPDMEHDDPNGKTVQPGAKAEMLWRFTNTGTFEFSCLIPGHREAGMVGTVTVK